jgi:hypothetical protein
MARLHLESSLIMLKHFYWEWTFNELKLFLRPCPSQLQSSRLYSDVNSLRLFLPALLALSLAPCRVCLAAHYCGTFLLAAPRSIRTQMSSCIKLFLLPRRVLEQVYTFPVGGQLLLFRYHKCINEYCFYNNFHSRWQAKTKRQQREMFPRSHFGRPTPALALARLRAYLFS